MPVVEFNDVMDCEADRVWAVLRKFGELDKWHPAIAESRIVSEKPDEMVGCIRKLTLQDGGTLTEQLLSIDDRNRALSYKFVEAPLPLDNYVLSVRVTPVTREPKAFISWSASFDLQSPDPDKQYEKLMFDLIASGSDSLGQFLGTQAAAE